MAAMARTAVSERRQRERDRAFEMARLSQQTLAWAKGLNAGDGEQRIAAALAALAVSGWRLLINRSWPEGRDGDARSATGPDLVLIGRGGVFIINTLDWRDPPTITEGRLLQDDADRTERAARLLAATEEAEKAVAELCMSPLAVQPILLFTGRRLDERLDRVRLLGQANCVEALLRLPKRLTEAQSKFVALHLAETWTQYRAFDVTDLPAATPEPQSALRAEGLFDVGEIQQALIDASLTAPIEGWMTFLSPQQSKLVSRSFNGPARISGAAGTGKTVVSLHRAVHLAQHTNHRVLFVTYANNLPRVQQTLARRLAPAAAERIEFTTLHALANTVLGARGVATRLRGDTAKGLLAKAWQNVGRHSDLARAEPNPNYWIDEVDYVIKGRRIASLGDYLAAERRGRRTGLRADDRRAVWSMYEEYERLLREADIHDFNDVLALALDEVRREPLSPPYASVIVDEVQDLTLTGVRLLHALVGDAPNGLLLVGDGQQAVYPGGYRLSEAGVRIPGARGISLGTNYRNRDRILQAALEVVAEYSFDDIDETTVAGDRPVETVLHDGEVVTVQANTLAEHDDLLIAAVRQLSAAEPAQAAMSALTDVSAKRERGAEGADAGVKVLGRGSAVDAGRAMSPALADTVVLCPNHREVDRYLRALGKAGLPAVNLETYDGTPVAACKVGTYTRVKGLDFKHVFIPRRDLALRGLDEDGASSQERRELALRRLYVAMTRARDTLWIGSLT